MLSLCHPAPLLVAVVMQRRAISALTRGTAPLVLRELLHVRSAVHSLPVAQSAAIADELPRLICCTASQFPPETAGHTRNSSRIAVGREQPQLRQQLLTAIEDVAVATILLQHVSLPALARILRSYFDTRDGCPSRVLESCSQRLLDAHYLGGASLAELATVVMASAQVGAWSDRASLTRFYERVVQQALIAADSMAQEQQQNSAGARDLALLICALDAADAYARVLLRASEAVLTRFILREYPGESLPRDVAAAVPCVPASPPATPRQDIAALTRSAWFLGDIAAAYSRQALICVPLVDALAAGAGSLCDGVAAYCAAARFAPSQPRLAALRALTPLLYHLALLGALPRHAGSMRKGLSLAVLLAALPPSAAGSSASAEPVAAWTDPIAKLACTLPSWRGEASTCSSGPPRAAFSPSAAQAAALLRVAAVPMWLRTQLHMVHLGLMALSERMPPGDSLAAEACCAPGERVRSLLPASAALLLRAAVVQQEVPAPAAAPARPRNDGKSSSFRQHSIRGSRVPATSSEHHPDAEGRAKVAAQRRGAGGEARSSHVESLVCEAARAAALANGWEAPIHGYGTPCGLFVDVALLSSPPTPSPAAQTVPPCAACDDEDATLAGNGRFFCGGHGCALGPRGDPTKHLIECRAAPPRFAAVAIEVDGPWHYVAAPSPVGPDASTAPASPRARSAHATGGAMPAGASADAWQEWRDLGEGHHLSPDRLLQQAPAQSEEEPDPLQVPRPVLDLLTIYRRWLLRSFGWCVVSVPYPDHATHLLNRRLAHRQAYLEGRLRDGGAAAVLRVVASARPLMG